MRAEQRELAVRERMSPFAGDDFGHPASIQGSLAPVNNGR
jgi:hypothetical protein